MRIVTGLLLAVCGWAQEYPKPERDRFVNDFANQLPLEAVQSLEKKVRDYQHATGNEIGVAIVQSLNGQSIDEYSQGLFRAWGVGRRDVNNGVLFVWAPKERQIRIHVGNGLEGVLTNAVASRIVLRVRGLFRESKYEEGVNAAVDGIVEAIGPVAAQSAPAAPIPDIPPPEQPPTFPWMWVAIPPGVAIAIWMVVRSLRTSRWREEIPRQLQEASRTLNGADMKLADARDAFTQLCDEAPPEVSGRVSGVVIGASDTIARLRSELDGIRRLPSDSFGEMKQIHRKLSRWRRRADELIAELDGVRGTLDAFRLRRTEAGEMLQQLPPRITHLEADGPIRGDGLLVAAADTYSQAAEESRRRPANWLLVYDLLSDVAACLDQVENPTRMRYRPVRYWATDDSAAFLALQAMQMRSQGSQFDSGSSSVGSFDSGAGGGGGGGFDSGGGFGGGDSGGGGASSDY
jgi:uncharacterized protein